MSIDIHHPLARSSAAKFVQSSEPLDLLGWGVSGAVFASPWGTAIKVYLHHDNYFNELSVYRRLSRMGITEIEGFSIPELKDHDPNLLIVEMSTVRRPWLLDFANARLSSPDFAENIMEEWWKQVEDRFGEKFPVIQNVYYTLAARCGIYYLDFKPGNIEF